MQVNETILNSIKTVHKDAVIIIRTGTFCNVYGQDAYIISYLFGYKLRRIQNNILATGFPKEVINKVMSKLEYRKIDYLVVNKKNNYEVEEKSINNNLNTYKKIIIDAKSYISAKIRVENINKYLIRNLNDKLLIEKIEKVINEGRKI
ncbi:MAG: hypothetical protein ACI4UX_03860 [Clostridia bacterium]